MWNVLLVEDCADTQLLVERALETVCRVRVAGSLEQARRSLERELPDLVLLDVSLPDGEGYDLCERLQREDRTRDIPIVFLTARAQTRDKVTAFSLGADDYVEKPFDPLELWARVSGRLAKEQARRSEVQVLRRGALRLSRELYEGWILEDGAERALGLTPHEFRLLYELAAHPARVYTRGQLLERVWADTVVGPRTVDAHVRNLRRKLGAFASYVESVRGVGYCFRADPSSGESRLVR